jgi:hypothetical protein
MNGDKNPRFTDRCMELTRGHSHVHHGLTSDIHQSPMTRSGFPGSYGCRAGIRRLGMILVLDMQIGTEAVGLGTLML